MTFAQAMISLQLMAEERIGSAMRQRAAAESAETDASWDAVRKQLAN